MNKLSKTVISGTGGTTFMTASSVLMSLLGQDFREPEHLGTMVGRLAPLLSKRAKVIAGWGAHYAMGMIFAAVYVELWESGKIEHSLKNALILGALSGVVGFLIWKATFKVHPLPPAMNYTNFYLQRIPAHIVFAIFATLSYRLIKDREDNSKQDKPSLY
ncbi:hypothetical protein [Pedobacter sp. GR22-6]|uniref:hypothetical protein n=1 Tax=Pedobacter sp. GR22-6 TaxID=3127957 RepID=UPI00307D66A6